MASTFLSAFCMQFIGRNVDVTCRLAKAMLSLKANFLIQRACTVVFTGECNLFP